MASRVALLRFPTAAGFNRNVILFSLLLILSMYVNLAKIVLGSRYYMLIMDGAILLLAIKMAASRVMRHQRFTVLEILAGLFLLVGVAELFNPNVPSLLVGIEGFRRIMFQMLAIFIGAGVVRRREDLIHVGKLIAIGSLPVLLYGVKQFYHLSELDYRIIESNTAALETWVLFGKVRAFGTFNGPFHLGLFSGMAFWIAVALYVETRNKLCIVVAVTAVMACLASLTRSSAVALFVSFPLVLFYAFKSRWVRVVCVTVAVGVLATAFTFAVRSEYREADLFYETILSFRRLMEDNRLVSRYEGYERGLDAVRSNPFGLGMGSSADAMEYHFEPRQKVHITSHNILLRIAVETGWLGLLLFLGILAQIALTVRSLEKSGDPVLAIMLLGPLAIVLITGIGGSTIGAYPVNLLFWSLCGLTAGYSELVKAGERCPRPST